MEQEFGTGVVLDGSTAEQRWLSRGQLPLTLGIVAAQCCFFTV